MKKRTFPKPEFEKETGKEHSEKEQLGKTGLEAALKEKVTPLLEETMEKNWGITIPKLETDLTDKLKNPQLQIYFPLNLNFDQAKKFFQKEFLRRELALHRGNVSQLAKFLGINRRSLHRAIRDLDLEIGRLRRQEKSPSEQYEELIDKTIRSTLEPYKALIQPQQMEKIYQDVPTLSKNIAQFLPWDDLTWKEAERSFERQFLTHALNENKFNIPLTARKVGIRSETLYRKIKQLGLKRS